MNKIDFITEYQNNNVCGYWIFDDNRNDITCSVCRSVLTKKHPAYTNSDIELPTTCDSCGASMY